MIDDPKNPPHEITGDDVPPAGKPVVTDVPPNNPDDEGKTPEPENA